MTMNIVRAGFGVSMVLSFPLMIWEARHNVDVLLFAKEGTQSKLSYNFYRFLGLNIGLLTLITSTAVAAPGVSPVIELIGSTCSPIMMYVLPAMFLLQSQTTKWLRRENAKPLCLLFTGALLIPLCVFVWIMRYAVCSPGEESYDDDHQLCKLLF